MTLAQQQIAEALRAGGQAEEKLQHLAELTRLGFFAEIEQNVKLHFADMVCGQDLAKREESYFIMLAMNEILRAIDAAAEVLSMDLGRAEEAQVVQAHTEKGVRPV